MNLNAYLQQFSQNTVAFVSLLSGASDEEYLWRPAPGKWCLLEIVCHLCDEERDDFRARVRHVLETPDQPMPPIDPPGWVTERKYLAQNFEEMLNHAALRHRAEAQVTDRSAGERLYAIMLLAALDDRDRQRDRHADAIEKRRREIDVQRELIADDRARLEVLA